MMPKMMIGIMDHQTSISGRVMPERMLENSHGNGASIRYMNPTGIALIAPPVDDTSISLAKPEPADVARSARLL
jgi:hypothetical protein